MSFAHLNPNSNMDLLTAAVTRRTSSLPSSSPSVSPPDSPQSPSYASLKLSTTENATTSDTAIGLGVSIPFSGGSQRKLYLSERIDHIARDFSLNKDHFFRARLSSLQEALGRLHDGTHEEFVESCMELEDIRDETLYAARDDGVRALVRANAEYHSEIAAANAEYENSRATMKSELLAHLSNKRRRLIEDKSLSDIASLPLLNSDLPGSPSLNGASGVGGFPRKLRHRIPLPPATARYPSSTLVTKTALDELLETLAESIKGKKGMGGVGGEERARERVEREREKLVRSGLEGVKAWEGEEDLIACRRKHVRQGGKQRKR